MASIAEEIRHRAHQLHNPYVILNWCSDLAGEEEAREIMGDLVFETIEQMSRFGGTDNATKSVRDKLSVCARNSHQEPNLEKSLDTIIAAQKIMAGSQQSIILDHQIEAKVAERLLEKIEQYEGKDTPPILVPVLFATRLFMIK